MAHQNTQTMPSEGTPSLQPSHLMLNLRNNKTLTLTVHIPLTEFPQAMTVMPKIACETLKIFPNACIMLGPVTYQCICRTCNKLTTSSAIK